MTAEISPEAMFDRAVALRGQAEKDLASHALGDAHDKLAEASGLLEELVAQIGDHAPDVITHEQAIVEHQLGRVFRSAGELPSALAHFQRSLELVEPIAPVSSVVSSNHNSMGLTYQALGKLDDARRHFERALEIDSAVAPNSLLVAADLSNLGALHEAAGDGAEAIRCMTAAEEIQRRLDPESLGLAIMLDNLAQLHLAQSDTPTAIRLGGEALKIFEQREPAQSPHTALCLEGLGRAYDAQGDLAAAREHLERAIDAFPTRSEETARRLTALGDLLARSGDSSASGTLMEAGRLALDIGSPAIARAAFERAVHVRETTEPESSRLGIALDSLAEAHRKLGAIAAALDANGRAVEIFERHAPGSKDLAIAQSLRGRLFYADGQLGRAGEQFVIARDILERVAPESRDRAQNWDDLGHLHMAQGDLDSAERYHRLALRLHEKENPRSAQVALVLNNLANIRLRKDDLEGALEQFREASKILEEVDPQAPDLAVVIGSIGVVLGQQGRHEEALSYIERSAWLTLRGAPRSIEAAAALHRLAGAYEALGETHLAVERLELGCRIQDDAAPQSPEMATYLGDLGHLYAQEGRLDDAIAAYTEAVHVAEEIRAGAGAPRMRERVFASHVDPYQALIAALHRRGGDGDRALAFNYAERARARGLADRLAERGEVYRAGTPEQRTLVREEHRLEARLAASHDLLREGVADPEAILLRAESGGDFERAINELVQQVVARPDLEEQLIRLRARMREAFPDSSRLHAPQPLDLHTTQSTLDNDVLLVEYQHTVEDTFVWAVRSDAAEMCALDVPLQRLADLVAEGVAPYHRGRAASRELAGQQTTAQAELARLLFGPIPAHMWEGVRRVVVAPDGVLYLVPFELLGFPGDGGELLLDRCAVSYAPSASILYELRRRGDPPRREGEFLGLGDPAFERVDDPKRSRFVVRQGTFEPLPGTLEEVRRIGALFGTAARMLTGVQATEVNLRQLIGRYRYVHLATHGIFDDADSNYSGLVLAPERAAGGDEGIDDFLQVYEILGLDLSAALVTCSACQTGLGQPRLGEGLVGMANAFLLAGAQAVVVSLWPVPDGPTARLMHRFYRHVQAGALVADALRAAKSDLRRHHPNPYDWASFVVLGSAS